MIDPLLTTAEVAVCLAMSEDWVREHAADLGAIRAGGPRAPLRFEPAAIEEWKRRQRVAGPEPSRVQRRRTSRPTVRSSLPKPSEALLAHFRAAPPPPDIDLLPMPPKSLLTARRGENR